MSIDMFFFSGDIPKEVTAEKMEDWFEGRYSKTYHSYTEMLSEITDYFPPNIELNNYFYFLWKDSLPKEDQDKLNFDDFATKYFEITEEILRDMTIKNLHHRFTRDAESERERGYQERNLAELIEKITFEFDCGRRVFYRASA